MHSIRAELVLASKNAQTDDIIFTFKQTFPRIILAEVNTHLVAGKNAASSRAIPTLKQLKNILDHPFVPIRIGEYKAGMQAGDEIQGWKRWTLEKLWSWSRYFMVFVAYLCHRLGASKQFSNRLVEPWMWVEQLWTSTDVENEALLRNHWMAEPHYQELACQKASIISNVRRHFAGEIQPSLVRFCQTVRNGDWHTPFTAYWETVGFIHDEEAAGNIRWSSDGSISVFDRETEQYLPIEVIKSEKDVVKAVSAGRCAWVSYYMPGANSKKLSSIVSALLTFRKLATGKIRHLSPLMHVATPMPFSVRVANLCGWFMYRKEFEGESGGDKVVPSITPRMARALIEEEAQHVTRSEMITNLTALFREELMEQERKRNER